MPALLTSTSMPAGRTDLGAERGDRFRVGKIGRHRPVPGAGKAGERLLRRAAFGEPRRGRTADPARRTSHQHDPVVRCHRASSIAVRDILRCSSSAQVASATRR
jgi:hypothetical protein